MEQQHRSSIGPGDASIMENYGGDTSLVQMPLVGGGNLHSSGAPDGNSLQMDASATGQARALLHMSTVANQE